MLHPLLDGVPMGRRQVTWDEFEQICSPTVHPAVTESREHIWGAFTKATSMLRSVITTPAVWVGGSYVTAKPDPSDIDVLYIVSAEGYARLSDEARQRVQAFSNNLQREKNIPVDTYTLGWPAFPELKLEDYRQTEYLRQRGYWDDWFQRHSSDKFAAKTTSDAVPRRGYLEVILDGYNP